MQALRTKLGMFRARRLERGVKRSPNPLPAAAGSAGSAWSAGVFRDAEGNVGGNPAPAVRSPSTGGSCCTVHGTLSSDGCSVLCAPTAKAESKEAVRCSPSPLGSIRVRGDHAGRAPPA